MNEEAKEDDRVQQVSSLEIIEKIRRGERILYENAEITGDLCLDQCDLPKDKNGKAFVISEISIKKSTVDGDINFSEVIICNKFNISCTNINGDAYFSGTRFDREALFIDSHFNESASFAGTHFENRAIFRSARFFKSVSFCGAEFKLQARLDHATFSMETAFEATRFEFAFFNGAKFYGRADFQGSNFERNAEFRKAIFEKNAFFIGAIFQENANFIEAEFRSDLHFDGALFNGDADFSRSQFDKTAFFNADTHFKKEVKLDEVKGSRLRFEARFDDSLNEQLSLKNSDISFIFAPWDSIKNHLAYHGSAYLALIRSYNNLEYFEDADNCLFQYRVKKRKNLSLMRKAADYIICCFLGYGVRPQYPLFLGLGIIIFSSFIYWSGNQASSYKFEPILLSLAIFFTQTGMDELTGLYKGISIIESAFGVLIIACFFVSLAKWTLR